MKMTTRTKPDEGPCLLGAHFSIAGGLHKALYTARAYGCHTLQIFTKNAHTWKERTLLPDEVERFGRARAETGIQQIAAHTSYLINAASPDPQKRAASLRALENELLRAATLDIPYVILHPGAHMGAGEAAGIAGIAAGVNHIYAQHPDLDTTLLLETTAGQGTGIGHRFEQLAAILNRIDLPDRVGVCLDTCHIHAAGYDLRTRRAYEKTIATFDALVGLKRLFVIHFNDARKALHSRIDRHAHIGEGAIGLRAFGFFMNDARLDRIPKIIETPKHKDGQDGDVINLNRLRSLLSHEIKS